MNDNAPPGRPGQRAHRFSMTNARPENDTVLDATGEECPVPIEMARERLVSMAPGEVMRVLSTDPVSPIDFEAWCMQESHEFLGAKERDGVWEIRLEKGL